MTYAPLPPEYQQEMAFWARWRAQWAPKVSRGDRQRLRREIDRCATLEAEHRCEGGSVELAEHYREAREKLERLMEPQPDAGGAGRLF